MRKYFVFIVLVLPIYAMAENVIFNPGFDMTPWDTGWTIETDTAMSGSCTKTAVAQVMPDTGSSLPNCCYLKTYVRLGSSGWCYGEAYAKTEVYQIFNEIPNCLIKAQIKYLWYWYNPCWFDDSVAIDARINGIWQTVWGKRWEDSTIWSEVSIGVNNPITGIRFRTKSWMYCGSLSGGASVAYRFWIDDICISEIGIEEKESRVKSSEFRVQQNPFARFT
ncbi:MAG: hypothetical protein HY769_08005, partial [Candidatus Stahlbacteria bacterium]|nr:hypothetical protein [Candidatus Stahlbacteria bacterium]